MVSRVCRRCLPDHRPACFLGQRGGRLSLPWRTSGVGSNVRDISDELLPSAGVGFRYEASRKYGVNIGIGYAVGDETSAFYFRIGEAF